MTQRGSVTERKRNAWRGMRVQCRGNCAGTASGAKRSAVRGISIKYREELILRLLPICRGMIGRRAGSKTSAPRRPIVLPAREIAATPAGVPTERRRIGRIRKRGNALADRKNENLCINIEILFFIKTNQTAFSVFGRRFFYYCKSER